jgi:CBS domain-containing protein
MGKQVITLSGDDPVTKAISHILKFRLNAILIMGKSHDVIGVVTKTE